MTTDARDMLLPPGDTQSETIDVGQAANEDVRRRRQEAMARMTRGALWCVGGLVVTIGTYRAASDGGMFLICWGPIVFGGIEFLKGLGQLAEA